MTLSVKENRVARTFCPIYLESEEIKLYLPTIWKIMNIQIT